MTCTGTLLYLKNDKTHHSDSFAQLQTAV